MNDKCQRCHCCSLLRILWQSFSSQFPLHTNKNFCNLFFLRKKEAKNRIKLSHIMMIELNWMMVLCWWFYFCCQQRRKKLSIMCVVKMLTMMKLRRKVMMKMFMDFYQYIQTTFFSPSSSQMPQDSGKNYIFNFGTQKKVNFQERQREVEMWEWNRNIKSSWDHERERREEMSVEPLVVGGFELNWVFFLLLYLYILTVEEYIGE